MFNSKQLRYIVAGLFLLSSTFGFAQRIGYVKITGSEKPNITIAVEKMKLIKANAIGREVSMAVFFEKPAATSETRNQTAACNIFEQSLLTVFDVRDRKEVQEKLASTDFASLADDLDFVILFSEISLDKSYRVSRYNKKQFFWSKEYEHPADLGQEYAFDGITLSGKVLRVKDNTLLGRFMLDFVPCSEGQGCPFGLKKAGNGFILTNLNTKQILPSEIDRTDVNMDEFLKDAASVISKILKNSIQ